jgi:hypothetical protein
MFIISGDSGGMRSDHGLFGITAENYCILQTK